MTIPKSPLRALRNLTGASQTLHCRYNLPPNPAIFYAKFSPDNTFDDPYKAVEIARQSLIKDTAENGISLVESLLPFVNISNRFVTLWVFCIRSQDISSGTVQSSSSKGKEKATIHLWEDLEALSFEGLQRVDMGDFLPNDIFSCSPTCATLSRSCPTCANATPARDRDHSFPTSSMLLPRPSLRDTYSMLICAIRERLINNVCTLNSNTDDTRSDDKSPLRAIRFGQGFLTIGECPSSAWGYGWERRSQAKYLIHTAFDIYLTLMSIYIRPMPSVTKLLPTPYAFSPRVTPHASLSPGTPLVLAPYPTPASYVSIHDPSTIPSSLRNEFWHTLKGLGALHDSHTAHKRPITLHHKSSIPESRFSDEPFILVYISLNNPRGEPKGLPALWPARLTFIDTDPNRIRLTTLPEIPSIEVLLTPPRPSVNTTSESCSMIASSSHIPNCSIFRNSSKQLKSTQRVMRTLELHTRRRTPGLHIHEAAKSTAGYVESVAKEREKEREKANLERLRREKEGKDKTPSTSSGPGSIPPHPLPTSTPSTPTASAATIPQKPLQDTIVPTSSWRSTSGQFFARTAQDTMSYSFYPSPPDCSLSHVSVATGDLPSGSFAIAPASAMSTHHVQNSLSTSHNMQTNSMGISNDMDLGMDIDLNDINIGIDLSRSMDMMNVNVDSDLVDGGFGSFGDALITDDDFDYFDKTIVPEHLPSSTSDMDKDIPSWLGDALTSGNVTSPVDPSLQRLASTGFEDTVSMIPPELFPSTPTARSPPTPDNPRTPSLEILTPLTSPKDQLFEPVNFSDRHHSADDKYTGSCGKFLLSKLQPKAEPLDDVVISKNSDSWRSRYDALTDPRVGVVNRLRGVKRKLCDDSYSVKSLKGGLREEEEWESMFIDDGFKALDSSSSQDEDEEELDNIELDGGYAEVPSRESFSRPSTPSPVGHPLSPPLLYYQLEHSLLLPHAIVMRPSFKELVSSDTPSVAISVPTPVSPAAALGSASERNKTLELLAQAMSKEHVENSFWAYASGLGTPFSLPPRFIIPQEHILELLNLLKRIPGIETSLPVSELVDTHSDIPPSSLSSSCRFKPLNQPKFSLGRAGLVHHVLPSALRFWEKEGLGPRAGAKNVVAFCLFQDGGEKAAVVTSWLERVARTYAARNFGTHIPGDAGPFSRGLVPLQFESIRKVLMQLLTALSLIPHVPHVVIYIIAPPSLFSSLESPILRSIIRSRKYAPKLAGQRDFDNDRILFHFVPDNHIADPYIYPSTRYLGLEQFVQSVYDRLLRVCRRPLPLRSPLNPANADVPFHTPAFVLARSGPPEACFQWEERPPLNVLDQHTFLHVGYRLSKCKKWLLAACIEERGEAHDLAVWNVPYHSEDDQSIGGDIDVNMAWVVENIWLFASQFTKRGDTEWRIVLSRFDEILESEVDAWITHLETAVLDSPGPPFHVSLVCAQSDVPLAVVPNTASDDTQKQKLASFASNAPPGSVFMDASLMTYSVLFSGRAPIISSSRLYPADQPSILGPSPAETDSETIDNDSDFIAPSMESYTTPIIPLGSSALLTVSNTCNETSDTGEASGDATFVGALYVHMLYACKTSKSTLCKNLKEVLSDITQSWHDISVLTRERWRISGNEDGNSISLPFHLAALDVMLSLFTVGVDPSRKETELV